MLLRKQTENMSSAIYLTSSFLPQWLFLQLDCLKTSTLTYFSKVVEKNSDDNEQRSSLSKWSFYNVQLEVLWLITPSTDKKVVQPVLLASEKRYDAWDARNNSF